MSTPHVQQRRSQRILLSISILVSGQHANGSPFSERTKTHVVNAHGALIELREPVLAGQKVRIKHLATNEEVICTVADINPGTTDIPEVGIAFAKPSPSFWRVSFPPEDWTPRSPEAKRVSSITNNAAKPVMVKK
ncbi:MAG: PilZ domain-containing protein [Candidatus Acidiferrum sp.]